MVQVVTTPLRRRVHRPERSLCCPDLDEVPRSVKDNAAMAHEGGHEGRVTRRRTLCADEGDWITDKIDRVARSKRPTGALRELLCHV